MCEALGGSHTGCPARAGVRNAEGVFAQEAHVVGLIMAAEYANQLGVFPAAAWGPGMMLGKYRAEREAQNSLLTPLSITLI